MNVSSDRNIDALAKVTAYKIKDGNVIESVDAELDVTQYGVTRTALSFDYDSDCVIVCDITCDGISDRCFYKDGTLDIVPCDDITVTCRGEDHIGIVSTCYVHAVELEGECVFEDNYFSMLPNEEKQIRFKKLGNGDSVSVKAYTFRGGKK